MCPPLRLGARRRSTYNRIETNVLHLSNHQETQSCKKKEKSRAKRSGKTEEEGKKQMAEKEEAARTEEDEGGPSSSSATLMERRLRFSLFRDAKLG